MNLKNLVKSQLSQLGYQVFSVTRNETGGRNPTFSALLTDGTELFVKIIGSGNHPSDGASTPNLESRICRASVGRTDLKVSPVSPLNEVSLNGQTLNVYPFIKGLSIAQELHSDVLATGELTTTLKALSEFSSHISSIVEIDSYPNNKYLVLENISRLSKSISLGSLRNLSLSEIEFIKLLQDNDEIGHAADSLIDSFNEAPQGLSHGDLRLDQILRTQSKIFLIDWEESGTRYQAYDLLCLNADIFFNSFYRSVEKGLPELTPENSDSFYQEVFEDCLGELAINWGASKLGFQYLDEATQFLLPFLSLYCFDRLMAISSKAPRLDVIGMSICGVAMEILGRSEEFTNYFCKELLKES